MQLILQRKGQAITRVWTLDSVLHFVLVLVHVEVCCAQKRTTVHFSGLRGID